MKTTTARDAARNFETLLDEVERGQTSLITRDGRTVAEELRPHAEASRSSEAVRGAQWQADYDHVLALMAAWPKTGYRVDTITDAGTRGSNLSVS